MADALAFAAIHELSLLIQRRELSPVELTEYYLNRIAEHDSALTAFMTVTGERALAAATAAEDAIGGGFSLGPLHGIPVALKDLIDVAGVPTTGGSLLFRDNVPRRDATVAHRLAAAGTVLLGKTHMVEFAYGGVGINHHYGTPRNPWGADVHRVPGGSSSGSAVAVAADLTPAALGSDTGGSVRIPASFCGLVGLKPTFGRISSAGVLPLDSRLDTVGPMARSVRDVAVVYRALAGPDPLDPDTWHQPIDDVVDELEADVAGMRICLPREYFWDDVEGEVDAAVRASVQVFADMGVYVDEISLEVLHDLAQVRERGSLTPVETFLNFREHLENEPEAFDPIVATRMLAGGRMTAVEYLSLQREYESLQARAAPDLHGVDALLTPTTAIVAPPLSEADDDEAYSDINNTCLRNTSAANLLGLCAVSLPCGFTRSGLPIGLQLIGRPFEEGRILRLAHAYEQATEWGDRRPPLRAIM